MIIEKRLLKCSSSIVGGFLTHLVMGSFYLWGNISLYVSSYYRFNGDPDLKASTVQAVFPFIYFGICTGHFIGIVLARKYGHKIVSGINMLIYVLSYFTSTYSNFYAFVFFMGFLPGICIGNEYIIPADNAYIYYPKRKGLVGGLILCGQGFGALVFNPILQWLINPDNESTQDDGYYSKIVADRLPKALRTITLVYFLVGMLGVLLMIQTRQYQQKQKTTEEQEDLLEVPNLKDSLISIPEIQIETTMDSFTHRELYVIWILFFSTSGFGLMMASQYKLYGINKIDDDNFLAIVGSIGGVANGLSRFMWASLLDYISPDILIPINALLMIILSSTFNLVAESKTCFILWMVLIYIQYGGIYSFYPTHCVKIFGRKLGLNIYNIVFTSAMFSNFTQFFIIKLLEPRIGYGNIFYIYTGFGVVALITHFINLCLKRQQKSIVQIN